MARVNISMPDELFDRARQAGLNISRVTQQAVARELDRLGAIDALDAHLAELEAQMGPVGPAERAAADEWAERVLRPAAARQHSG